MGKTKSSCFLGVFDRILSYLQVMRTYIKAYTSLNFGQIPPLTMELAALERLKNRCHHVISVDIDPIFFKLAGNKNMHNIMNEFEFRPERTTDYGVSCPWASQKYPYRPYNGENGVSTFSLLFLIGSFWYFHVTRTSIKAWMSLNFLKWDLTLAHWTQVSDRCPFGFLFISSFHKSFMPHNLSLLPKFLSQLEPCMIMFLSFWTDSSGQTDQAGPSLIRVYTVWSSLCIIWMHYTMVKPPCSNYSMITTNFSGVRIYRIFTLVLYGRNTVVPLNWVINNGVVLAFPDVLDRCEKPCNFSLNSQ